MGDGIEHSPYVLWMLTTYAAFSWVGLLLAAMFLDVLSGWVTAFVERKLSSKVSFRGMMKKASMLLVVWTCYLVEVAIIQTVPDGLKETVSVPIAKIVASFFFFTEVISVLENAKRMGVPLPLFLMKSLSLTMDKISQFGVKVEEKIETTTSTSTTTLTPIPMPPSTPEPQEPKP